MLLNFIQALIISLLFGLQEKCQIASTGPVLSMFDKLESSSYKMSLSQFDNQILIMIKLLINNQTER